MAVVDDSENSTAIGIPIPATAKQSSFVPLNSCTMCL